MEEAFLKEGIGITNAGGFITFYSMFVVFLILAYVMYGKVQAYMWGRLGSHSTDGDEHFEIIAAGAFAVLAMVTCCYWSDYAEHFLLRMYLVFSWIMAYPFFQAGTYYLERNKINYMVYQEGFWSEPSDTSTARWNLSATLRTTLFVLQLFSNIYIISILI